MIWERWIDVIIHICVVIKAILTLTESIRLCSQGRASNLPLLDGRDVGIVTNDKDTVNDFDSQESNTIVYYILREEFINRSPKLTKHTTRNSHCI